MSERPAEREAAQSVVWQPWLAPAAFLSGLAVAVIVGGVLGGVAAASGADPKHPPPIVGILTALILELSFVGSALLFARSRGPLAPHLFGLRRTRLTSALGWLVLAAVLYVLFSATWAAALHLHERDTLPTQLGVDRSTLALVAVSLLLCVSAPIAEELFFRGFFFSALRNWHGPWLATILTGLTFGAVHAGGDTPVGFLVPLAFFGMALCVLRWVTGSLYPCFALHAINNSIALGALRHWHVGQVALVALGALTVIAVITGPFARRVPAPLAVPA